MVDREGMLERERWVVVVRLALDGVVGWFVDRTLVGYAGRVG